VTTDQRGAPFARVLGGAVDIGALEVNRVYALAGPGAGGRGGWVEVRDGATHSVRQRFRVFGDGYAGQTTVAVADLTGDGTPDIIVGQRNGPAAQVRVFDGVTFEPLAGRRGRFQPFATGLTNGVYVAAGDVSGDGVPDVIVGSRLASSGRLAAFSGVDGRRLFGVNLGGAFRGAGRGGARG
jgi:hypothetical protein